MTQSMIKVLMNGAVGRLIFSNPQKHNALTQNAWQSISKDVGHLLNEGARVIIVSGDGKSFCAGADISEFDVVRKNAQTARVYEQSNIDAFAAIRSAPVPTLAMIRGNCLGGGFGLAAACDLRLADTSAKFSVPAARLGLGYPVDAMADIVHSIGVQNTKKLLFSVDRLSAEQMTDLGFILEVYSPEELDTQVMMLANQIANLAPLTHQATKAAIAAIFDGTRDIAAQLSDETFTSNDYLEGRTAFREKRTARFKGN